MISRNTDVGFNLPFRVVAPYIPHRKNRHPAPFRVFPKASYLCARQLRQTIQPQIV